jgi:hypothetical protein
MSFLQEFAEEGLLERVITSGEKSGDLPKVNPGMDQNAKTVADIDQSEPGKAGDENKDDDPTKSADSGKEGDKLMKNSLSAAESLEAAMDHMCEECGKDKKVPYNEDMKRKLKEYHEASKDLKEGLYEMANMESY